MIRRFAVFTLMVAVSAGARVISYAPYTDRIATPAVQNRLNRFFALVEQQPQATVPIGALPPNPYALPSQVVLYDSKGLEEPRVVYPQDGSFASLMLAAAREEAGVTSILIQTFDSKGSTLWMLSTDSGTTWKSVGLPAFTAYPSAIDNGGPFARAAYSQVRIGTSDFPFVVAAGATIYGVTSGGDVRQLVTTPAQLTLIGSDREGGKFIAKTATDILTFDVAGHQANAVHASLPGLTEGWITPDGAMYVSDFERPGQAILWYGKDGSISPAAASWEGPLNVLPPINSDWQMIAVPTADFSGAWVVKDGGGRPTTLYQHTPSAGLVTQWQDVSAPDVEALIAAQSGTRVLVQVHRPRQSVDNLIFKDPAIAVWHVGDPAPRVYDELFLSETSAKGFVHVDVDAIESGDPFVFDSGAMSFPIAINCPNCSPSPATPGGGSDVIQEWGVVRASLQQQLILPGVGHTAGAFGSNWATDLTVYNPANAPVVVTLFFVPNGFSLASGTLPAGHGLTLAAHEIRQIPDVVATLFGSQNATGELVISPEEFGGVNVTSRTYNTTPKGTYGFTMNGIDVFSGAGPRFPLTFSGAFQGANYRTNMTLADVSGRGTTVDATAAGTVGASSNQAVSFNANASGQTQINFLGPMLGVGPSDTGALVLQPSRGETVASVFVVDNRTNDPTFFPPDIPASVMRVIPAIGHLDGANGSKFRSDLFLFNNSSQAKTLTLQAKLWDSFDFPQQMSFTLLPHEARVIPDVLLTAFGKTGIARLRFTLQGAAGDTSVRVTSRTYTIDPDGGTYGFLMPPLNSFQSGSPGDTLEILGATLDARFRTNLGLVDLAPNPTSTAARAHIDIVGSDGATIDSFDRDIPSAGGVQINDLFHARALPDDGKPVLIRVTTIQGMIGAYAAIVDNGTNDPAYVAANLAAH